MKQKIILRSLCLVALSCTNVGNNFNIFTLNDNPNVRFYNLKESISSWDDSNCYLDFSFTYNTQYKLYLLSNNDEYKGYFITNNLNKVEKMYVGSDAPLIDNISLLSLIFGDGGDIENENNENLISTISTNSSFYETPTLITDLYTSSYNSNSSEQKNNRLFILL